MNSKTVFMAFLVLTVACLVQQSTAQYRIEYEKLRGKREINRAEELAKVKAADKAFEKVEKDLDSASAEDVAKLFELLGQMFYEMAKEIRKAGKNVSKRMVKRLTGELPNYLAR